MKLPAKYSILYSKLSEVIPKRRLLIDELSTLAFSADASFYKLTPKLIIKADNEHEIVFIIKVCSELIIPITFRAAGTSLSGQAITDSVLVMIGNSWKNYSINNDATKISLQPGIIGGHINNLLAQYKKKIGPDPASINSAMIGGIAANNASGMCCGTAQNCYKTLSSMRIIFANGEVLDTSVDKCKKDFAERNSVFVKSIMSLRDKINSNEELRNKISRKYKIKNTTGYGLNSFLDFEDPIDIIQHLMIGSEGTLGFISEITLNTVSEFDFKASALITFQNIEDACKAAALLKLLPVDAVELMDRNSIRSVENKKGMPDYLKTLNDKTAALLIETKAENNLALDENIKLITNALQFSKHYIKVDFTKDKLEYTKLWNIRKGLFPSVGAARNTGTTVIIEDIAFPIDSLSSAVIKLRDILDKYDFSNAIIFGHALEGNLHFVFSQNFSIKSEIDRYDSMMNEISQMVISEFDGSLKAEHGTGRNMAPFVEYEWGAEAYSIMKEIKNIFDPEKILNPGVILNEDENIHLKNLKELPATDEIIDKCTECGFCESRCVSEGLTLSPRQRISAFREMKRLQKSGDGRRYKKLFSLFKYSGDETCATDGLCSNNCPVGIDTGLAIKNLRAKNRNRFSRFIAKRIAHNFSMTVECIKILLETVHWLSSVFGENNFNKISGMLTKISGNTIPRWNKYLPRGNSKVHFRINLKTNSLKVVYFPSCINRMMGTSIDYKDETSLTAKTILLLHKAGYEIIYPSNLNKLCCGMSFNSKGFYEAGQYKLNELINELKIISENGTLPILFDMSPCYHRTKSELKSSLKIYEPVEFILTFLKDKLIFNKTDKIISIYSTCSTQQEGLADQLRELAELCSSNIYMPEANCCGFAGDKGLTHPELNEYGLKNFRINIPKNCSEGYSTSRTCEIGLTTNTGISFKSIIYLIDECTIPISKYS